MIRERMHDREKPRRLGRRLAAIGGALAVGTAAAFATALPANAATITGASFVVSSNVAGATGVVYNWNFTPATSGAVTSITLTVPTGTTWTAASPVIYGATGCTVGTTTFGSLTVTIPLTTCSLSTTRPVSITISNVTNGPATTVAFGSDITTTTDSGTSSTVSLVANTTAVTVRVPQSLTFSNSNTAIELLPIPGATGVLTAPIVTLGVATNATSGYTLEATLASPLSNGVSNIVGVTAGTVANLTSTTGFGAQASVTGGATLAPAWVPATGSSFFGYAATTGATGSTVASNTGPTAGDTVVLTNGIRIPATQQPGNYTGTVTYTVTPTF